jgi:hypothetical protein
MRRAFRTQLVRKSICVSFNLEFPGSGLGVGRLNGLRSLQGLRQLFKSVGRIAD